MPIIDIHTHVFPDAVAERATAALINGSRHMPYTDGTVGELLGAMDRSGVDISVLQPVATRANQVQSINTWTAALASDRLVPFGGMHPDFEEPEAEIERMVALGMRGIKLHPEFQEFDPLDPRMDRIYRAAAAHGLTILFHAGADPSYESVHGTPRAFKTLIAEHPQLTVVLAHLGGYEVWDEVAEHLVGERVYFDTAYTLGHLADEDVRAIITGHGADHVLFGSDAPWTDISREIELLRELGLAEDELEAILWRNAAQLLDVEVTISPVE